MNQSDLDLNQLQQDSWDALKAWYAGDGPSPLGYLTLFRQERQTHSRNDRQATNTILERALDKLTARQLHKERELLQRRFLEEWSIQRLQNEMNLSEGRVHAHQKSALKELAVVIHEMEMALRDALQEQWATRLDAPSYVDLVGVDEQRQKLLDLLAAPAPPYVIAIHGLGGIGKTALADAVMRAAIAAALFTDFAWLSAKPNALTPVGDILSLDSAPLTRTEFLRQLTTKLLPDIPLSPRARDEDLIQRLSKHLRQVPQLIAVDNLETVVDAQTLLPLLHQLANPSKFLVTTREIVSNVQAIYRFPVPELDVRHALQLIRQEAMWTNLPTIANYADAELMPIVDTVGGNPLALRLVVGLMHTSPLETVLQRIVGAQGQETENLYNYIFRYGWEQLDELSRRVFLLMPLVGSEGEDVDFLADAAQLSSAELSRGLRSLVQSNLVNVQQDSRGYRYRIHSLTRTFLLEQALQWV